MKGFSKIFFIISCHLAFNLFGQITPNGNTGATTTSYTNGATDDPLYIWVANGVGNNTASLTATPPSGTGQFTFDWFYHNSANSSWTSYFSETTATTSTISNLPSDGYRVQIYDGSNNLIGCYTAWVWNMNADVTIADAATACDGTDLTGSINTEGTFTYFNPPPPESLITAATDITVCFSATHTYISDLGFYLVGPPSCGSPVINLSPNPGAIGQNDICNSSNDISNLCFSVSSTNIFDMCNASANATGNYGLYGPGAGTAIDWTSLYGCNAAAGGWSVQIYDCIGADVGTLTASDITFSNLTSFCGSPTSITYSSGVISSAINDNSCDAGTASIFQVPVATDLTTPIVANATTSYLWTADNGASVPTPSSSLTPSLNGLPAGITNFTLTTTLEYNGISGTVDDVFAFTNTCCSAVADAGLDVSFCSNSSSQIGSASQVGYTYLWSPTTGLNDPTLAQPTVSLTNGTVSNITSTYTLTATNVSGGGCSTTDDVDVTVNPLPTVNAGVDQTLCDDGTAVTLSGSGAVSYTWDNGVTDGASFSPTVGTTTYTVTGTDANNCTNTDQVDVIINALPIVDAGLNQTLCDDGTAVILSGSGAISYIWDNGVTDGVSFSPTVGTTTYSVTGTDFNSCSNSDQVDVTVNPLPIVDAGTDQPLVCEGDSVLLYGSGANSYTWDNNVIDSLKFIQSVGTVTYNVIGTDVNGCLNNDQVIVTVNPLPSFTLVNPQAVCNPELVDLTDGNLITSPIETLSYFIDSMSFQALISPDSVALGGIYYIKNTSSFGCEYILPVEVEIYDKPIASFFSSPSTLTNYNPSASMVNTSVGGMDYEWFFDDGETSNEINPTKLFDYTSIGEHEIVLIVTSGDMCKDTSSLVVEMQEKLLYYIPNTFTPNKDQFNNVFLPVFTAGFDPYDFTMLIFNRWGELIFESHNSDIGWDGSYNGNLMSDGVYLYKIEFVEKENNKTHIETGQLMLIK